MFDSWEQVYQSQSNEIGNIADTFEAVARVLETSPVADLGAAIEFTVRILEWMKQHDAERNCDTSPLLQRAGASIEQAAAAYNDYRVWCAKQLITERDNEGQ